MTRTIPMPSPRGSNRAGLYITVPHSPAAAYDSARGLGGAKRFRSGLTLRSSFALDEEAEAASPDRESRIRTILALLKDEVSPEDLQTIAALLNSNAPAQDEPPAFPGKPIPGGGQVPLDVKAMDSKSAVRVIDAVISARTAARGSFAEMFPHAAAIAKDAR